MTKEYIKRNLPIYVAALVLVIVAIAAALFIKGNDKVGNTIANCEFYNDPNLLKDNPHRFSLYAIAKVTEGYRSVDNLADNIGKSFDIDPETVYYAPNGLTRFCFVKFDLQLDYLYGFMDRDENTVIPPAYYYVYNFDENGYAKTCFSNGTVTLINEKGEDMIGLECYDVHYIEEKEVYKLNVTVRETGYSYYQMDLDGNLSPWEDD